MALAAQTFYLQLLSRFSDRNDDTGELMWEQPAEWRARDELDSLERQVSTGSFLKLQGESSIPASIEASRATM